jgi:hypothetical protein
VQDSRLQKCETANAKSRSLPLRIAQPGLFPLSPSFSLVADFRSRMFFPAPRLRPARVLSADSLCVSQSTRRNLPACGAERTRRQIVKREGGRERGWPFYLFSIGQIELPFARRSIKGGNDDRPQDEPRRRRSLQATSERPLVLTTSSDLWRR